MNHNKISIIIQARTGSKRFPRKVLSKIENRSLIWHVINRAKQVEIADQIILITTKRKEDDVLTKIAEKEGILCYRGHTYDVLSRYYQSALKFDADPIIRITGDCPLIDNTIVNKMVRFYLEHDYEYVTNVMQPTYPDGLDIEILSLKLLRKINNLSKIRSEREHVTPYIRKNSHRFRTYNFKNKVDYSTLRWTVDEKEDLLFVRKIYERMRPKLIFGLEDVLKVLSKNPEIIEINKGIMRNEGYYTSLRNDKK